VDVDRGAIAWCSRHLPGDFRAIGPKPPLSDLPGSYDRICAVSVLTHMDEPAQRVWIAELRRLLRVGGQEGDADGVLARRGKLETGHGPQERVGHLHRDAGAVARGRLGSHGSTVVEVVQCGQGVRDDRVADPAEQIGDERDAAGV